MRLGGFNVRNRRCQTLPQTQQVVNTVGGKLPVLPQRRRGTGEKQVNNRWETGEKQVNNRWTTGEKQVRNRWTTGEEQVSNTWYTHLQTGDGEVGYETNNFRVVFYFDQLPQLVVTLQSGQQTTELVVVVWIRQTLKHKQLFVKRRLTT